MGNIPIIRTPPKAPDILPISKGGTGNAAGNAPSATKLQTARTIRTNLASTGTAGFDGTANVTPGVTGVLPAANGGTGQTSLASLAAALGPLMTGGAKIETGYYSGTGKSGSANPCSITCSFPPKFVFVSCGVNPEVVRNAYKVFIPSFLLIDTLASVGYGFVYHSNGNELWTSPDELNIAGTSVIYSFYFVRNVATVLENTVSWYGENEYSQLNMRAINSSGTANAGLYYYIAIG